MKPGDAGQRVQREHEPVAVEHEARSRAASAGRVTPGYVVARSGPATPSAATTQVAASSSARDGERAERPRAQHRARVRVPAPQRGARVIPALDDGELFSLHAPVDRQVARPPPAGATAAARSAGPERARPPRGRSARTSSIRRAGARGSGSAPRRPAARAAARARSARPGTRSPARPRVWASIALQRRGAEALEAAGQVAHPTPSTRRAYSQPAQRDDAPLQAPVLDPAAVHVARAQHEVGARRAPARSAAAGRPGRARGRRPSRPRSAAPSASAWANPAV